MPLGFEHGGGQERGRGGILGIGLHREVNDDRQPPHQGRLAACPFDAGHNDEFVGLLHHLLVEHPLVGEVVVDRRSGPVGADGDLLKSRAVITTLAEHLTGGVQNTLPSLICFRRRGTSRAATGRERH